MEVSHCLPTLSILSHCFKDTGGTVIDTSYEFCKYSAELVPRNWGFYSENYFFGTHNYISSQVYRSIGIIDSE